MPEITVLHKSHDRASFDCGVPELNSFLRATARQHDQKGISRTFVLTENGSSAILGFFTLTLCEVSAASLPDNFARIYPSHVLPAVRLGRLAVSIKDQKRGFGALLLSEAVHRTGLVAVQAGLIGLFVDAKDDTARNFYMRYGFLAIPEQPYKLFLPIETIRKLC